MSLDGPRRSDRIVLLDALRGFALLGIAVMNVQGWGMPSAAYVNPTAFGPFEGADHAAWLLGYLLCDLKFISLFSLLFGAGVLVSTGTWGSGPERPRAFHLRRMGALFGFGLAHAYLVWFGDILVAYALCGLAVYAARHAAPERKIRWAAGLLLVPPALSVATYAAASLAPALGVGEMLAEAWGATGTLVPREVAAFTGTWTQSFGENARLAFAAQTGELLILYAWRASGFMLLGMALLERGVLAGRREPGEYARLARIGFAAGLPVVALSAALHEATGWQAQTSFLLVAQLNGLGSVGVALGWLGLVGWVVRSGRLPRAVRAVATLGRVAFSAYVLQSVAGTFLFRGWGLGFFGTFPRTALLGVAVGFWLVELALAPLWLRRFAFGPLEWAWRCLSYARRLPLRREAEQPAPGGAPRAS